MQFMYAWVLGFLLLVPVGIWMFMWAERVRRERLTRLGDAELLQALTVHLSVSRRRVKAILWLIALSMLIIALARPFWGQQVNIIESTGVSVMILLDTSKSMDAEDLLPSRLARAKLSIADLLEGIEGNEVGLIAFAGTSFVVSPLTTDTNILLSFLDYITTDTISRRGTNISQAILTALESFRAGQATQQIIVILSDGEDHEQQLEQAVLAAQSQSVVIHTIGYGTVEGQSIPIRNRAGLVVGNHQDRFGNVVITRLEEVSLRRLAQVNGGIYQRFDGGGAAIQNLVTLINAAEAGVINSREQALRIERFVIFAVLALLALSFEILLTESRQ